VWLPELQHKTPHPFSKKRGGGFYFMFQDEFKSALSQFKNRNFLLQPCKFAALFFSGMMQGRIMPEKKNFLHFWANFVLKEIQQIFCV
jgi:hypothetical protein